MFTPRFLFFSCLAACCPYVIALISLPEEVQWCEAMRKFKKMAENDTDMAMVTDPATPRKQSEATPEATNFLGGTVRYRLASFCDPALTRIGAKHRQIVNDHRKNAQGLSKHLMPSLPSHLKQYHCRHDHAHAQHQPHQSSTPSNVFFFGLRQRFHAAGATSACTGTK